SRARVAPARDRAESALLAAVRAAGREGVAMRRAVLAGLLVMVFASTSADAHPLGNFTVNHLSRVSVGAQRIDVSYTLDQAEIPTFQERGLSPSQVLERMVAEVRRGLQLTVAGRRASLVVQPGARITFPPGQGGLRTTRVE